MADPVKRSKMKLKIKRPRQHAMTDNTKACLAKLSVMVAAGLNPRQVEKVTNWSRRKIDYLRGQPEFNDMVNQLVALNCEALNKKVVSAMDAAMSTLWTIAAGKKMVGQKEPPTYSQIMQAAHDVVMLSTKMSEAKSIQQAQEIQLRHALSSSVDNDNSLVSQCKAIVAAEEELQEVQPLRVIKH